MWILALALSLSPQNAAPSPPQSELPAELRSVDWQPLNGVVAQAGDAIVLSSDVHKTASRLAGTKDLTVDSLNPEEVQQLYGVAMYRELLDELSVQAGEDLGISSADVDRLVRAAQRDERLRQGVGTFSDNLRNRGLDAVDWELGQRSGLFKRSWEQEMLGKRGYASERPHREEFIRPGKLFAIYRSESSQFGTPTQVQFQDINVPVDRQGVDWTLAQLERLLEAVRDGSADFGEQAALYNPKELAARNGLSQFLAPERLTDPIARQFALEAEVGEISDPIPLMVQDKDTGASVVGFFKVRRLATRIEGTPPPLFSDPDMQTNLRQRIREVDATVMLYGSRRRLFATSYRWLQPGAEPPLAPPPPQ